MDRKQKHGRSGSRSSDSFSSPPVIKRILLKHFNTMLTGDIYSLHGGMANFLCAE